MTTKDLEQATGISRQTIYNHINRGWLDACMVGSRWNISPGEAMQWARWCWESGKIYMYPPYRVKDYIHTFYLRKKGI